MKTSRRRFFKFMSILGIGSFCSVPLHAKTSKEIVIPKAYILKQGYWNILERLKNNKIEFTILKKDSSFTVEEQLIKDFKTRTRAYEGHYPHYNTTVTSSKKNITFSKGDIYISICIFNHLCYFCGDDICWK